MWLTGLENYWIKWRYIFIHCSIFQNSYLIKKKNLSSMRGLVARWWCLPCKFGPLPPSETWLCLLSLAWPYLASHRAHEISATAVCLRVSLGTMRANQSLPTPFFAVFFFTIAFAIICHTTYFLVYFVYFLLRFSNIWIPWEQEFKSFQFTGVSSVIHK